MIKYRKKPQTVRWPVMENMAAVKILVSYKVILHQTIDNCRKEPNKCRLNLHPPTSTEISIIFYHKKDIYKNFKINYKVPFYFRYNLFQGCPNAKTVTLILRGGAEQFIEETERSLHDAIMIVRRALKVDTSLLLIFKCQCC